MQRTTRQVFFLTVLAFFGLGCTSYQVATRDAGTVYLNRTRGFIFHKTSVMRCVEDNLGLMCQEVPIREGRSVPPPHYTPPARSYQPTDRVEQSQSEGVPSGNPQLDAAGLSDLEEDELTANVSSRLIEEAEGTFNSYRERCENEDGRACLLAGVIRLEGLDGQRNERLGCTLLRLACALEEPEACQLETWRCD